MSTRDDDALAALIDRVAHDLTAGDAPATLARNIRARIGDSGRTPWFAGWRMATAGAALVLVIALVAAIWPERPGQAPIVRNDPAPAPAQDGLAAQGGAAAGGSASRNPPYIGQSQVGRVPRPSTGAQGVPSQVEGRSGPADHGSRPAGVTVVVTTGATTDAMPLPGIAPLTVGAIEDPVLVAEMSGLTMPIEIEPLQVVPLDVLTASDAGL